MKLGKRILSMLIALAMLVPAMALAEAPEVVSGLQEQIVEEQGALSLEDFTDAEPGTEADAPSEAQPAESAEDDEEAPEPEEDEDAFDPEADALDADGEAVEVIDTTGEADPLMVVANNDAEEVDLADEEAKAQTDYAPRTVEVTIKKNASAKVNNGDTLVIVVEGKTVKSWSSDKKSVATVAFDGEKVVVSTHKVGSAKLTAKLSNKKKITVKLTVADPYLPTAVSLSPEATELYVGYTMDLSQAIGLTPSYARTTYTWKSSKAAVASVSKAGVLTAKKAGKTKITVTTKNKKKTSVTITVKANKLDGISPKPAKADVRTVYGSWTLWPKSVEVLAGGKIACEFYLLNGVNAKSSQINNLQLSLYNGATLLAQKTFSKVKVACGKRSTKTFKVTFSGADVVDGHVVLPQLSASQLKYDLNATGTTLKVGKKNVAFIATRIPTGAAARTGNTKYRALCIGQSDYKHANRLPICVKDAAGMETMLRGLNLGYTVTTRSNRTASQILSDISTAFSGATSNDVSLFYYSGHGFGDEDIPQDYERYQGALCGVNANSLSDLLTTAQLASALSRVPGKVIVILDSCFSGAAISTNAPDSADSLKRINQSVIDAFSGYTLHYDLDDPNLPLSNSGELATNKFIVMTASSYSQTSLANAVTPLSLFTTMLLTGVGMDYDQTTIYYGNGGMYADANGDRKVTLKEAYVFTKDAVDECCEYLSDYFGEDIVQTVTYWGTDSEVLFSR